MGQLPRRMEIEHEVVVDRLIDLQAELRGERSPRRRTAGGSTRSTDQWAYGSSRRLGATPRPARRATASSTDGPGHPFDRGALRGDRDDDRAVPADPVEVSVGDVAVGIEQRPQASAQPTSVEPPVRLASILARAQRVESGLSQVIEQLDETAEQLETPD